MGGAATASALSPRLHEAATPLVLLTCAEVSASGHASWRLERARQAPGEHCEVAADRMLHDRLQARWMEGAGADAALAA